MVPDARVAKNEITPLPRFYRLSGAPGNKRMQAESWNGCAVLVNISILEKDKDEAGN